MFTVEEIAIGLSRIPRFGGQTVVDWSVAQHSLAARQLGEWFKVDDSDPLPMHALLHDATEALTSDVPTTWKTEDFSLLQRALDRRLYWSFGLELPSPSNASIVKRIDRRLLLAEAYVVTPTKTYEHICLETREEAQPQDVVAVQSILAHDDLRDEPQWAFARALWDYLHEFGRLA